MSNLVNKHKICHGLSGLKNSKKEDQDIFFDL